ncbi:MAG: rubredoxin [Elainellaceae cyanobacterium]
MSTEAPESNTPEPTAPVDADALTNGTDEAIAEPEFDRYECRACGYTYEPLKGDGNTVAAGTLFEDIDEGWRCPVCGAPKRQFNNVGPVGNPSGFKENLSYGFGVNTLTPGQKNILIFGGLFLGFLFFLSVYGLK